MSFKKTWGRGDWKFIFMAVKVKKALGIMSRTRLGRKHYLILDFDGKNEPPLDAIPFLKTRYVYRTRHGWHVITDYPVSFRDFAIRALELGADPVWVGIGLKRGYWYLEVKNKSVLKKLMRDKRFRFMVIERGD
ncbi:MAG: hypothetical protein QXH20_03185 [Candidatus Bathyarchaeia archaeon]